MSKNITLIDADSLAFLGTKEDTIQQIIDKVDYKITSIVEETKADYYALFISKGSYFRHRLKDATEKSGTYKANRTYTNQNYNKLIKEYLAAEYNANVYSNVEADDIIKYWMNKKLYINLVENPHGDRHEVIDKFTPDSSYLISSEECNIILAAVDKDLLQSIPGKHLNYNKKVASDTWDMVWIETSETEAKLFKAGQLITGDTSDGVRGIPGKGIKHWESMQYRGATKLYNILEEYIDKFGQSQGIYEFQKNYRMLHLLEDDADFLREVGYVPELPNFLKANKVKTIDVNFD